MIFDAPNSNRRWADLLIEEAIRCGVTTFFLAPGSRSTPLTTAVAAHPRAEAVMHFDERGTAFAALGYGRATGRPAAWITTSGTAVANALPAVVEAATDGVPMLLLTADRPPELRQTGANQTIDQVKIFGDYVRWFFDLPAPHADLDPTLVLTTLDQAIYRATRAPAGPVHLNCMFREPLAPIAEEDPPGAAPAHLRTWYDGGQPFTRYAPSRMTAPPDAAAGLATSLRSAKRGLIVAGRMANTAQGQAVLDLADHVGWPLLPDIGAQIRLGTAAHSSVIPYFDLLLADDAFAHTHGPDCVLHFGQRATSKRLLQWLARHRPTPFAVVNETPFRYDPTHQVTHRLETDIVATCAALMSATPAATTPAWQTRWRAASDRAGDRLAAFFEKQTTLTEPGVARYLTQHLPEGHGLVLASSMPIRDVDQSGVADGARVRIAANRGASGIDGTVATAVGFAEGLRAPVTLLIGDLALLHDLNALALLRAARYPVTVVAINNDGGGIFSFLPIAQFEEVFEPYFGTPHGLGFRRAAELFGLAYAHPETPDAFADAYQAALARPHSTLLEVTTDRTANRRLHQELLAFVKPEA